MKSILSVFFIFISFELYGKQATDWQLSFQNPATDLMGSVVGLHNIILIVMTLVTLFVLLILYLIQENLVRQVPILMNQENTNTT